MNNYKMVQILNAFNENEALRKKKLPVSLVYPMYKNLESMERAGATYTKSLQYIEATFKESGEKEAEITKLINEESDAKIEVVPRSIIAELDESKYDALSFDDIKILDFMISDEIRDSIESSVE